MAPTVIDGLSLPYYTWLLLLLAAVVSNTTTSPFFIVKIAGGTSFLRVPDEQAPFGS